MYKQEAGASIPMSESSLSQSVPAIEATNICEENYDLEKVEKLKEVEEDLGLLELSDAGVNDAILIQFSPNKLQAPLSSPSFGTKNRRYTLRPKRRPETTDCDNYTSAKVRKKSSSLSKNGCLETIFENPVLKGGSLTLMGQTKLKRHLSFNSFVSKTKLKQRKLKLKRLAKGKKNRNSFKVTVEDVKRKLKTLDDEEDEWMDVQE